MATSNTVASVTRRKYPVLDGETGSVDLYGYATTERGAVRVANRYFADDVGSAYLSDGPIVLADGSVVQRGWVALTVQS